MLGWTIRPFFDKVEIYKIARFIPVLAILAEHPYGENFAMGVVK